MAFNPRNRWFNIYLHKFSQDDSDEALHDHPADSLTYVIAGGYCERYKSQGGGIVSRILLPGDWVRRPAEHTHRVVLFRDAENKPIPAWTLFISFRKRRVWGFWCGEKGDKPVPWHEYLEAGNYGKIGAGCGEYGKPDENAK